jgi:glycosylphosphatidylinositol transamidase (GPIT) subunit GPI8
MTGNIFNLKVISAQEDRKLNGYSTIMSTSTVWFLVREGNMSVPFYTVSE